MITSVSPTFLKQEAKKLKKSQNIPMSQALDEISKKFGFFNYRHYLNTSETSKQSKAPAKKTLLKSISSEKDLFKKMNLAISSIVNFKIPFNEHIEILNLFQDSGDDFDSSYASEMEAVYKKLKLSEDLRSRDYGVHPCLQFVCEKLNLMEKEIQFHLFKDANSVEGKDDLQDRYPEILNADHFIASKASVSNLIYSIDENTLHIDGDYSIRFKFDSENILIDQYLPKEEYYKGEYLNDRKMTGSFGVKVDGSKKITLIHMDM